MKLRILIRAVVLIAACDVVIDACELPPIDPPPYNTFHSWAPGPRVVLVHIDDDFTVNPAIPEQYLRPGVLISTSTITAQPNVYLGPHVPQMTRGWP